MIAGWLANKLAAPILLGLCALLVVGLAIQTVRINGISVFGWYAVSGLKHDLDQSNKDRDKALKAYSDYSAQVAQKIVEGQAKYIKQNQDLQAQLDELRQKHDADQKSLAETHAALLAAADKTKPSDLKPLGPAAIAYLKALYQKQQATP